MKMSGIEAKLMSSRFRRLFRAMPSRDVGNLVRHHAGQFGFIIGGENQAAVDVEESAGKSERVDLVGLDDFDREWNFRIRVADEVLSDAVDVFVDRRIVDQLDLAFDFGRQLAAHRNFFFEGDEVDAALVDIAVSDVVDIGVLLACSCLCLIFAVFLSLRVRIVSDLWRRLSSVGVWARSGKGTAIKRARTKHEPHSGYLMHHLVSPRTK